MIMIVQLSHSREAGPQISWPSEVPDGLITLQL